MQTRLFALLNCLNEARILSGICVQGLSILTCNKTLSFPLLSGRWSFSRLAILSLSSHSKAMSVFYKIVKLAKNGVLMIIHIYAKVSKYFRYNTPPTLSTFNSK
jgi:hypothetical protein